MEINYRIELVDTSSIYRVEPVIMGNIYR